MTLRHPVTISRTTDSRDARSAPLRRPPIPVRLNVMLLTIVVVASVVQLFGLAILLRAYGAVALLLVVPIVVLTPTHWGLIHEGIHSQLFASRRLNETVARLLAVALGVPFDAVRFGHLMHHRFTREPYDQPDLYDGTGPLWRARLVYYARLLGGTYASEIVAPLLAFMPTRMASAQIARAISAEGPVGEQVQRHYVNFATDPKRRSRTRRDWILTLAVYGAAFGFYGDAWPVLLGVMLLRGVWISLADNLPHFGVALDEPGRARNFKLPRFWQTITMNHHLHRLHHQHPTLPWTTLPTYAEQTHERSIGSESHAGMSMPLREPAPYFRAALRQFRGPTRAMSLK